MSEEAVRLQVYDSDGTKSGPESVVNTTTLGRQVEPDIAELANGGFVVTWTDVSTGPGLEVRAQIFTPDGMKVGGEFNVNTTPWVDQRGPTATGLPDGRFVAVWSDSFERGADRSQGGLYGQVFNADSSKSGPEFLVNTTTEGSQFDADITVLDDGRFVVTWTSFLFSNGVFFRPVRGQVFDIDGTPSGTEFRVGPIDSEQDQSAIAALEGGRFVVAWQDLDHQGVFAQIFDTGDSPIASELRGTLGNDDLIGTDDAELILGLAGNDRLLGAGGDDLILGGAGNDTLIGGFGDDTLRGDEGQNFLNGIAGANLLDGGSSADTIYGGSDQDTITGHHGADELRGLGGDDLIFGGHGSDTLIGNSGNDTLAGGSQLDLLFGNDGNDVLNGGWGNDLLHGASGADRFYHSGAGGHGSDWVQDFMTAEQDILVYGDNGATLDQFGVNFAQTVGAGDMNVAEAFVVFRPTGQIMWALVDGEGQSSLNIELNGQVFDLLA